MKYSNEHDVIHWVVVADASRMQLFASDLMLGELVPLEARVHPASRVPARELVSDDRGAMAPGPTGPRTRFERHTEPQRAAIAAFAAEIADLLREGRLAGRYQRLVLVAPPAFLGLLRPRLDIATARTVVLSIAREWTTLALPELTGRIRTALQGILPATP
jgi:protein required for attachment to host cells